MTITDLIRWKKSEPDREAEEQALQAPEDPFASEEQVNRMFDAFLRGVGLEPLGAFHPRVDVVETDKAIEISAELPGLEEKDIEVKLSQNVLTLSGEKRDDKGKKGHSYLRAERSYGSFKRSIPLLHDVDASQADAVFRNGVLTVTVPRTVRTQERKRITIKAQ